MLTVSTHIGGSKVVVFDHNPDNYIDARYSYPGRQLIELVRGGQVRQYIDCSELVAPDLIVRLMRNKFQPLTEFPVSTYEAARINNARTTL